ncbi:AQG_2a_G0038940.mRNA.1.CDS.1 [Saccharomyces cerevisiae]|uniref:Vac14p n=4 Tax=Saccharomyces TaxID=4930 RepID=C8ZDZ5_YEAS8|nr:Vac14p [Saccharomyces cerevisiae YJM993]AJV46420.1 Vac14p [Saccharomyces cerevisiae YJM1083]AJV47774.1 Vac14p [Saccharomyces cerevisiae YJM1190]AJV48229.1 Vac14p [Saccharomyces cerevisiae YJM1199]AJV48685.1 Vac14p [Saccharomyces cerevisiae YJM1202]AJV49590.1 Vac14p [Saccharomyces cerevisiae YJM1242]AJV50043.1 Vac14p [Saccharomyces cerevisiae YJM1244]AJV50457.1 Vac14p [Saccharomyces cerevisiae YJM1248]AJV50907.1 Vac14p [Saccharomyces cerevisiae YJM1250]AJV51354.1 Vac14p [Saccharomyces ce
MEKSIAKGLSDKLYEKRKAAALELEKLVKQCVLEGDYDRIDKIIDELCRDYAYALHQPMARNAGLMGLAATAIALGINDVGRYLRNILPPVLACFGDQNDQVRFYACESLYNIAKIAKGEILVYFNEIFDVLCKISADTENSVRGAAELLDRLIKDIVAERASNYISIVNNGSHGLLPAIKTDPISGDVYQEEYEQDNQLAFSLPKFIPLLTERIYAINPDTRVFLVDWLKVLLNTPGLELISYLPSFLGGLFTFLGDSHKDVRTVTHTLMDSLLHEVDRISKLQTEIKMKRLERLKMLEDKYNNSSTPTKKADGALIAEKKKTLMTALGGLSKPLSMETDDTKLSNTNETDDERHLTSQEQLLDSEATSQEPLRDGEEYIPGQDINLNFPEVITVLVNNLASSEAEIQLIALHWIQVILSISPNVFIPFLSKILSVLLKLLSDSDPHITEIAQLVNGQLLSLCSSYVGKETDGKIAYGPIVNSLTLQFFDSRIDAKIACLDWLILIYHKAPNQILKHNDSMFLTLLKSLSNRDSVLIEKALSLLQSLCSDSNDNYLRQFLQDLLTLFKRDTKLVKTRANFIMRQISSRLSPERVYKVISSILDNYNDTTFVKMMIQILSTNLITSPEMSSLRNKLRTCEDGMFFNSLFKSWCPNPVSVISLCFVAENYELAYTVLQTYANYELKLNDLVQLDILIQLFESPVFTRMRLQLLEQQKHPFLHKCLFGILMIIPQSKAFETLNRRLNSLNIWTSQSYVMNNYIRQRENSNFCDSNSDISQRSVSQSKLHFQELINHFKAVSEEDEYSSDMIRLDHGANNKSLLLGSFLDGIDEDKQEIVTPISPMNEAINEEMESPNDSSSVILKDSGSLPFNRNVSDKLKK